MSLVCWSGGADSTLVLWQLAQKSSVADPVRTISIKHPQVWAWERSRQARLAILAELKSRGCHVHAFEVEVLHREIDKAVPFPGIVSCGGLTQPGIWMATAALYLLDREDLYLGYVMHDDVWHVREEMWQAFNSIKRIRHGHGSLQFPLELVDKPMVYDELEKAGLLALTWSCEDPTEAGTACLSCHPCEVEAVTEFVRTRRKAMAKRKADSVAQQVTQVTPDGEVNDAAKEKPEGSDVPVMCVDGDTAGHCNDQACAVSRGLHQEVATSREGAIAEGRDSEK